MLRCSLLCNVPSADPDIQNRASTIEIALQHSTPKFNVLKSNFNVQKRNFNVRKTNLNVRKSNFRVRKVNFRVRKTNFTLGSKLPALGNAKMIEFYDSNGTDLGIANKN